MFVGATNQKRVGESKKEADFNFRSIGIENKIIEKKDVPDFIESNKYVGGVFDDKIGSIHPAKLVKSMIHLVHKRWTNF